MVFNFLAKIKFENFQFFLKMIDTPGFTHNTNIRTYYKNLKKNIIERVVIIFLLPLIFLSITQKFIKKNIF